MPFPIYRILKAFIWDQTEQQHLLWNIIFSLSFIALQVLICFWSLLQFKGYIYLNLSFISNLRVLSTPPGPFQALNPKKWWQPKKSGQHGRFVPWSSDPECFIVVFTEKCNISTAKESSTANKTNPRGRCKKLENRPRVSCQKVIIYLKINLLFN